MKVLVTGGAGFIGRALVETLAGTDHQVIVFDNLRRGTWPPPGSPSYTGDIEFISGDVRDLGAVRGAMRGVERVYHLAAQSNVVGAAVDIEYSFTTNVVGTFHVLLAAQEAGVERVVFTSSREVYGEVDSLPVPEDAPLRPKNSYGAGKAAGEIYCRTFAGMSGLEVNVLRLANVYGAGDRDRVIPIWLACARQGHDLQLFGGEQILDFVPLDFVVEALVRAGETSLAGQPVNVGSGVPTHLSELAERIRSLARTAISIRRLPARSIEVTRFVADVSRMRALLGLEAPAPLENLELL